MMNFFLVYIAHCVGRSGRSDRGHDFFPSPNCVCVAVEEVRVYRMVVLPNLQYLHEMFCREVRYWSSLSAMQHNCKVSVTCTCHT